MLGWAVRRSGPECGGTCLVRGPLNEIERDDATTTVSSRFGTQLRNRHVAMLSLDSTPAPIAATVLYVGDRTHLIARLRTAAELMG